MTDKLNEGDSITLEMIEMATKAALNVFKIKPVYVNGVGYYVWWKDKSGGWIPVEGDKVEDVLEPVAYWGVK